LGRNLDRGTPKHRGILGVEAAVSTRMGKDEWRARDSGSEADSGLGEHALSSRKNVDTYAVANFEVRRVGNVDSDLNNDTATFVAWNWAFGGVRRSGWIRETVPVSWSHRCTGGSVVLTRPKVGVEIGETNSGASDLDQHFL
jgi:hypothetical protein